MMILNIGFPYTDKERMQKNPLKQNQKGVKGFYVQ